LLFVFTANSVFSQELGILLEKKNSERIDFLKEHKRIKVVTTNGKELYGRFSILNDSTIAINSTTIPLKSIAKIKRKSMTSLIASPVVPIIGVIFILGGTAVAATGGSGAIAGVGMISSGFTMTLASLISNKHEKEKWKYTIGIKPNN
jgi:ABC-type multidrug transport system fused ATPase/permease subunit